MVAFLMLGIVPGTNIQIDFNTWLGCMGALCALLCLLGVYRSHIIALLMIRRAIKRADPRPSLMARLA